MRSDLKKLDSFTSEASKNHLIRNFLRNGRLRVKILDNEIGCRAYSDGDAPGNGWHGDTVTCSVVKRLKPGQKVAFVKNAGGLNRGPAEHPYTGCLGYMIR